MSRSMWDTQGSRKDLQLWVLLRSGDRKCVWVGIHAFIWSLTRLRKFNRDWAIKVAWIILHMSHLLAWVGGLSYGTRVVVAIEEFFLLLARRTYVECYAIRLNSSVHIDSRMGHISRLTGSIHSHGLMRIWSARLSVSFPSFGNLYFALG